MAEKRGQRAQKRKTDPDGLFRKSKDNRMIGSMAAHPVCSGLRRRFFVKHFCRGLTLHRRRFFDLMFSDPTWIQ